MKNERISDGTVAVQSEKQRKQVKFKQTLVDQDIILSVRHLKQFFTFGSGTKKIHLKAVHDVSFDIKKGECFGLVGESGCGKTTTGRSIIRLYDITSGSIYFKGHRISAGSRWNEKEIKWSKIRAHRALRDLKDEAKEMLSSTGSSDSDFDHTGFTDQVKADLARRKQEIQENLQKVLEEQKKKIKQIKYDNRHVERKLLNKIQMIFQDPIDSLDPRMTVSDIIQEGLIISRKIEKREAKEQRALWKKSLDAQIQQIQQQTLAKETQQELIQKAKDQYNALLDQQTALSSKKDYATKVVEVLEKVGLVADYASRYPHEFSGGQRQRIGIARALIMKPELLICDEPISALDVSIRAQVINLLNELKEELGLTILFIAHDLSVVKYFCDRIAVMYYGEIVELASSDELFAHPLHPYTKALLSAIPKPDPLSEKNRIRIVYEPSEAHDYSEDKPKLVEIVPGHFVLGNGIEIATYQKTFVAEKKDSKAIKKTVKKSVASPRTKKEKSE